MERHLCTSVAMIVTLMSAHRSDVVRRNAFDLQDEIARIDALLRDDPCLEQPSSQVPDQRYPHQPG